MNAKRWLAIIGTVAVAGAATDCPDKLVRKWIEPPNGVYDYLKFLNEAVCQLEKQHPTGLDPAKQICPPPPGDKRTVPTYPPP
ncbi:MAG: hypothetical protein QOH59_399 [Gemmatimonadales bacterium]|jgi:hypothetical protein|nr:hypothetical protein [Gemmatimonadales bacterium]